MPEPSAVYPTAGGRCAIVTHGHTGIARAVALEFARQGMHIAFTCPLDPGGRDDEEARRTAIELGRLEVKVYWRPCDARDERDAASFVNEAVEALGGMHVLVNGVAGPAALGDSGDADRDRALRTANRTGAIHMIRASAPLFRKQRYGRIVTVIPAYDSRSKQGGHVPKMETGLASLTRVVALDLGPYNITVNAVAPACVRTGTQSPDSTDPDDRVSEANALRRIGDARDVANVVVFLCSDLARHVTGAIIPVDGGRHL